MKRFIILLFFLLHTPVFSAFVPTSLAAGTTGLNYQVYAAGGPQPTYTQDANGNITNRTLLSSGIVSTVGISYSSGVLGSGRTDGFIIRFYGYINIPSAGTYQFGGQADDGIRIKVNGTSVVNSWIESGGAFRSGSVALSAGVVAVEVMYYENGGGEMVNFQWYVNGSWQYVPTASLATDSTYWAPATPQYTSSITTQQQARVDAYRSRSYVDASIHIDQVGDNNSFTITQVGKGTIKGVGQDKAYFNGNNNNVTIRQGSSFGNTEGKNQMELSVIGDSNTLNLNQGTSSDGTSTSDSNRHYQLLNLTGSNNTVTTVQKDGSNSAVGNFMENTISGSSNVVNLTQQGSGAKILFGNVNGSSNTVTVNQKDSGQHYLDYSLIGNGHSVNVTQEGAGTHRATIGVSNAGGSSTVNLNQSGTNNQTYSIQQSCAIAGGCSTTITQNQ